MWVVVFTKAFFFRGPDARYESIQGNQTKTGQFFEGLLLNLATLFEQFCKKQFCKKQFREKQFREKQFREKQFREKQFCKMNVARLFTLIAVRNCINCQTCIVR